jgi:hypothetical protein
MPVAEQSDPSRKPSNLTALPYAVDAGTVELTGEEDFLTTEATLGLFSPVKKGGEGPSVTNASASPEMEDVTHDR